MTVKRDLRQFIRPLIPMMVWRWAAGMINFFAVLGSGGTGRFSLLLRDDREATTKMRSLRAPIHFRRCSSHASAILQNCIRREYDRHLPADFSPSTIIDGGTYIGDLGAHWASKWESASICCVEPSEANAAYARQNLAPYGDRIRIFAGALWNRPTQLQLSGSEMASSVSEIVEVRQTVRAFTIPELMAAMRWERLDVLKLDIEGAEYSVLDDSCNEWLPKVGWLIIEFHGAELRAAVERRLESHGFKGRQFRSLVTFSREW